ncbi:MAG: endonuclease/exonuclease/phosphatase family protein [Alphaproteobacteria bacterium]|nr:endonuclease/exonuclease/phosphatase family protein [Alphaproteobacteria bacterium]MCW5742092.1 endonuclease/exonuclease/phosphatase family protein [Alphaproteobacteria bacterium]
MLFATYNIHFALGTDNRYDVARIADVVAEADVVCLQEVVQGWALNAHADQAQEIAGRLNRYVWFHGGFDADASSVGADGRIVNRRRTFGNAVLSRWPIAEARGHLLPKTAMPGQFDLQRSFVEAVVETPKGRLRVYSIHLSHITHAQRLPQVAALLDTVLDAPRRGGAWDAHATDSFVFTEAAQPVPVSAVVMGDFNFTSNDVEYVTICGEMHAEFGRIATADGLSDAWTSAGNAEDRESFAGEGRIDHAFVTHDLRGKVKRAWIDDTSPASDHWPLFVEIDV